MSSAWIQKRPGRPKPYMARFAADGARVRSRSFERKRDAEVWLANQKTALARGEWVDPRAGTATLEVWAVDWLRGRRVAPATHARDEAIIKSLIVPALGRLQLGRISAEMLRGWVADMERAGKSPATISKAFGLVSQMLEQAVRDNRLGRSPARYVDLPRETREEMRFLTADQVATLVDATDDRYRAMVLLAAYSGLRWGELAGLKVDALDLPRGRLHVLRTVGEVKGKVIEGDPKTASSRRAVAIPRFVADALAAHLAKLRRLRPIGPNGWVFPAPAGGPLRRNAFRNRVWEPAIRAVGLEGVRFHDLRHTHAALLIAQGEHPKTIQSRLGHASISTTLDVYGHLFEGLDESAAAKLDTIGTATSRDRQPAAGLDSLAGVREIAHHPRTAEARGLEKASGGEGI